MRILVINGPNLNMLGKREPEIYGSTTLEDLCTRLKEKAASYDDLELECFQSNSEGDICTVIQNCLGDGITKGIILNAGAYSHYSIAIRDALAMLSIPIVSVHISNITKRESFRHDEVLSPVCTGMITGLGMYGYEAALDFLMKN